jgi:hypothetical protein
MTNYQLALADNRSAPFGQLEPIAGFTTNAAGAQIVDTVGPLRQIVTGSAQQSDQGSDRRYLVIVPASATEPLQIQLE